MRISKRAQDQGVKEYRPTIRGDYEYDPVPLMKLVGNTVDVEGVFNYFRVRQNKIHGSFGPS